MHYMTGPTPHIPLSLKCRYDSTLAPQSILVSCHLLSLAYHFAFPCLFSRFQFQTGSTIHEYPGSSYYKVIGDLLLTTRMLATHAITHFYLSVNFLIHAMICTLCNCLALVSSSRSPVQPQDVNSKSKSTLSICIIRPTLTIV